MLKNKIKIFLVEDNPPDARIVEEHLKDSDSDSFTIKNAETLLQAINILMKESFDIILLDLNLPDSMGVETFERIYFVAQTTPIILITGIKDEHIAKETIKKGAQDYLTKNDISTSLLTRSIHYSIERLKLSTELEKTKQLEVLKKEIETLDNIPKGGSTKATEFSLGIRSLRGSSQKTFMAFSNEIARIMEDAIDERMYKINKDIAMSLRLLADDLGGILAGPQDVVEIYSYTLKEKLKNANYELSKVYLEEGRMVVLQLMGYLVSFYRKYIPSNLIINKNDNK